jgi:hypothetical protein
MEGLSELLATSAGAVYAPLVEVFNNQWIEINESLIRQYAGAFQPGDVNATDLQKFQEIYLKHPFVVIKDVLPDDTLQGTPHHHYRLVIDGPTLKQFMVTLGETRLNSVEVDTKSIKQFNAIIDRAKFGDYPFEVWIGKSDKLLRQLTLEVRDRSGIRTNLRYTVDRYNQSVRVEKPADAKSLLKLLSEFSQGGSLTAPGGAGLTLPPMSELDASGISL